MTGAEGQQPEDPDAIAVDPAKVLDAMADGVVIVDRSGTMRFVSERITEMSGYAREQLVGASVELLVPESARVEHERLRTSAQDEEGLHRPMGTGRDIVLRRSDGTQIPVDIALSQLDAHIVASVRDARSTRAILSALEEERRRAAILTERARIARDLHDGIIQQLFAVGLSVRASKDADVEQQRGEVVARIDDAIRDLRAYVTGMHEDATPRSLIGSLTDVISQMRTASKAPIEPMLDIAVARRLHAQVPVIANFAREAMMNAVRHAGAKRIELNLRAEGADAILEVIDDGRGFDVASIPGTGAGLPNLRARASALGGRCVIESKVGSGTRVALHLPLRDHPEPRR
jgi:PAS domain S-box-containing protein